MTKRQDTKKKKSSNPVINGLIFLTKSVYSQWKVLVSITIIFMIITTVLATATFVLEHIGHGGHFKGPWIDNPLTSEIDHKLTFGESFWWVFITISTVGYGDIYPVTAEMRAWGVFISIVGISFLALYTAVVVNGFTQEFQKRANPDQFEEVMNNEEQEVEIERLESENKKLAKEVSSLKEKIEAKETKQKENE